MADLRIMMNTGQRRWSKKQRFEAFKAGLRGELLTPDFAGYNEARAIWNAMIDRRPALIVARAWPVQGFTSP